MERPFPAYKGDDPYIFVSYAHEDVDLVYPEIQWLHEQGFNIWYDEGINPGSSWRDELADYISGSNLFLYLVTPRSIVSSNCRKEVNFAIDSDEPLIAIHLQETELPTGMRLTLSDIQAIRKHDLTEDEYREKLLSGVKSHITQGAIESKPSSVSPVSNYTKPILVAGGLVALAILAGSFLLYSKPQQDSVPAPPVVSDATQAPSIPRTVEPTVAAKPSIAVLAFENMSADPEQEFFSDGISEEILNGLAKNPGLRVIARSSSFSFKGRKVDIRDIGKTLGVGFVVEGSVRKAGNRIRVTAQLINTQDGSSVWSDRFDRELTDIFRVQDDISSAVLAALDIHLTPGESGVRVKQDVNIEAYNAYLQGRYYMNRVEFAGSEAVDRAISYFKQAIAADPEYADAYGALARTYNFQNWFQFSPPQQTLPLATQAFDMALALDPNQAEALAVRATNLFFVQRQYQQAIDEFHALAQKFPSDVGMLFNYRLPYSVIGKHELAVQITQRAVRLDPMSSYAWFQLSGAQIVAGQFEDSRTSLLRSEELGIERPFSLVQLAVIMGDEEIIPRQLAHMKSYLGETNSNYLLASALDRYSQGKYGEARDILVPLHAEDAAFISNFRMALMAIYQNDIEAALSYLSDALSVGELVPLFLLSKNEYYHALAPQLYTHPRYAEIMKNVGLDQASINKLKIPPLPF